MFNGGVVWNTNRDIAIRINRIEYFSVESDTATASLIVHYTSGESSSEEITIEKMGKEQHEEFQQFQNRFNEQFRESVAALMLAQSKEELNSRGHNSDGLMSMFSNSADWMKR
jgi:phosphosulfolactate phosphohydrolase-like enzyme